MSILKRIGVGLGMSALAVMMLTNTVIAKSNDHPNTTYVDQDSYLPDDKEIDALQACTISNFDAKGGNSVFSDSSSKHDIEYAYKSGYKIIDLGKMADKMNAGLIINRGTEDYPKNEVLNNGVMIIRSYVDGTFAHYICKCNESEFIDFFNIFVHDDYEDHSDLNTGIEIYTKNIIWEGNKIAGRVAIKYDPNREILDYTFTYY